MFKSRLISQVLFPFFVSTILIFLFIHKPYVGINTPTYTEFTLVRQPLFPIFLSLFRWAGEYQFILAMWVQGLLTIFGFVYARWWLKKNLNMSDSYIVPAFFFALITISFHYQIYSLDDPEGISFPLFIFAFFQLIDCFLSVEYQKIVIFSILVGLLILTRTQFYIFYGAFVVLISWYLWKKFPFKYILVCLCIFGVSAFFTNLLDRAYHYYKNSYFSNEPFSGILTVIQPLYLANENASRYFKNPEQRYIVQKIQKSIQKNQLNHDVIAYKPTSIQYYEYINNEYGKNYLSIQDITNQAITHTSFFKIYDIDNLSLIRMDRLTLDISKTLFLHNIKKNVLLYFYKVIDAFGGIFNFLFFSLLMMFSLIKVFQNRKINMLPGQLFLFLMLTITFFNAMVVAIAEPNCTRYFCYTQFLLYCFGAYFAECISIPNGSKDAIFNISSWPHL